MFALSSALIRSYRILICLISSKAPPNSRCPFTYAIAALRTPPWCFFKNSIPDCQEDFLGAIIGGMNVEPLEPESILSILGLGLGNAGDEISGTGSGFAPGLNSDVRPDFITPGWIPMN